MKFATKPLRHYPPHLRHVATLHQEIKNSNFQKFENRLRFDKVTENLKVETF